MSEGFFLGMPLEDVAEWSDAQRAEFLAALDESDVEVSDWEARFVESNLGRGRFSVRQRKAADRLIEKYRGRIGW